MQETVPVRLFCSIHCLCTQLCMSETSSGIFLFNRSISTPSPSLAQERIPMCTSTCARGDARNPSTSTS